jgi:hypothetical protein
MDAPLHQLCQLCQDFQFRVKDRCGKWEDMGSYGRWWNQTQSEGAPLKRHHRDFDALLESARSGCHLCSLLSFAFKHDEWAWAKRSGVWKHHNIMISYHSTNKYDSEKDAIIFDPLKLGNLVAEWKDHTIWFDVVRWPISNCYIQSFVEPIMWPESLGTAMKREDDPPTLVKVLTKKGGQISIIDSVYPLNQPRWTSAVGYHRVLNEPHLLCMWPLLFEHWTCSI